MTYVLTTLHKSSELDSSKSGLNTAVCMHLPVLIFKIKLWAVTGILIKVINSSLTKTPFTPTSVLDAKKLSVRLLSIHVQVHTGGSSASF